MSLSPPIAITLNLTPAKSPSGRPWEINMLPVSGVPLKVAMRASEEGVALLTDLLAGRYALRISDGTARYFYEEFELSGSHSKQIDLPVTPVRGRVRLGGRPLTSTVMLSSGAMDSVTLEAKGGEFEGSIRSPSRGFLSATVVSLDPPFTKRVLLDDVDSQAKDLELAIDLDDLVAHGIVLRRDDGRPIPGVVVTATAPRQEVVSATTGPDGRFQLRPLARVRYQITTRLQQKGLSQSLELDATNGGTLPEVRIEVAEGRTLKVRFVSASGELLPRVVATLLQPVGSSPMFGQGTDATGVLTVPLPPGSQALFVQAYSTDFTAFSGCLAVPAGDDDELRVVLPDIPGASLRLEREGPASEKPIFTPLALVSRSGGVWLQTDLQRLPRHSEEPGVFTGLPAGEYAAVYLNEPFSAFVDRWCSASARARLSWVTAVNGQTSVVRYKIPSVGDAVPK